VGIPLFRLHHYEGNSMRHFTTKVATSCTYVLDDTTSMTDPAFVRVQQALVITMGANPECMTDSEERVLADFIRWVGQNLGRTVHPVDKIDQVGIYTLPDFVVNPIFCYHNLSEGHSLVCIWSDSKGKINYIRST
jgi:hypothetical protein